ncbi:MAG: hypothetical protein KGI67_10630 [Pseudomonadota bacterium]|nr:hypothetical protein [Pseudomonadota bacterium]
MNAWLLFLRDWRAGELRLAGVALLLAVAAVSTVGFVQDRVAAALVIGAARLTAGDLVLASDQAPAPQRLERLAALGLAASPMATFSSMLRGPSRNVLVSVKAVAANYPLRGVLRVSAAVGGAEVAADGRASAAPRPGEVLLAPGLAARLGLGRGDRLRLGRAEFAVAGTIVDEPDGGLAAFRIAPRVMIAEQDLAATGLIRAGSRVSWRLAVSGAAADLARWRALEQAQLAPGERIESAADSRPEVRSLIEQAGQFLRLSSLASVLLASVALLFALRRHVERQRPVAAILRCLGASRALVWRRQAAALGVLGVLAGALGVACGAVLQAGLARILAPLVDVPLPAPGWRPALDGMAVGLILLAGFALPGLYSLGQVAPLRVLRNEDQEPGAPNRGRLLQRRLPVALAAVLTLLLVAVLGSAQPLLAAETCLAMLGVAALAALASRALIALGLRSAARLPQSWRLGVRSLARRPGFASLQAGALAVGLLVLLVLGLVRNDLLASWQASVPADAPNHFVLGIQADETAALQAFLRAEQRPPFDLRPLVRARLVAIDGKPVDLGAVKDPRERALLDREFNLSWAEHFNADNRLVAGSWWPQSGAAGGLSLERGFAERLHLGLGSRLRFDVAGVTVESTVASLRTVRWDSFQPNFFVIVRPGLLGDADASYLASFHLAAADQGFADRLVERFPQITLVDTGAMIAQVRGLTAQMALAVQFVFALALLAGVLVLLAGIQATHDERLREGAVMRALGATRAQLRTLQLVEFSVLGAAAGLCAAAGALLASWLVSTRLLELEWHFDPWIPVLGSLGGLLLVGITAALALRPLGRAVPAESLRLFG